MRQSEVTLLLYSLQEWNLKQYEVREIVFIEMTILFESEVFKTYFMNLFVLTNVKHEIEMSSLK
jgi:hypothetical protein